MENLTHEQLVHEGRQIVLAAPQLYLDVDLEGDGKAGHGSILSIGAIAPKGEEFYEELKPLSEDWIDGQREFCENHGLQREWLIQNGVDPYKAIKKFVDWTRKLGEAYEKPVVFTAFNAGWDHSFVDLYIYKAGLNNPFSLAPFDLKSATLHLSEDWNWAQTAKGKLPTIVLPDGDFEHHALLDAIYQQKIHFALAGLIARGRVPDNNS